MATLKTRDWRTIRYPRPFWPEDEEDWGLGGSGSYSVGGRSYSPATRSGRSMSKDSGADRMTHSRGSSMTGGRSGRHSDAGELLYSSGGSPKESRRRQALASPVSASGAARSDRRSSPFPSSASPPSSSPYTSGPFNSE